MPLSQPRAASRRRKVQEDAMRDAIEFIEWAEHGHEWSSFLDRLITRARSFLVKEPEAGSKPAAACLTKAAKSC